MIKESTAQSANAGKPEEKKKKAVGNPAVRAGEKRTISWYLIPILLTLGILPLVTRMVELKTPVVSGQSQQSAVTFYDFFLYGKSIFLLIVVGIMIVILVERWLWDRKWPKLTYAFIPLGVYALWVIISSASSEYTALCTTGVKDSFQSVYVLLAYCILPIYCFVMVRSESDVKKILKWWPIAIALLFFVGFMQLIGKDFWGTWLGRHLMLPKKDWETELNFRFEAGRIYMSQYNPNYVGMLTTMLISLFGVMAIYAKRQKRWIFIATAAGMLVCLLGAQSKNGIIATVITGCVLLLFLRKKIRKHWGIALTAGLLLIGSIITMDFLRGHFISNALKENWDILFHHSQAEDEKNKLEDIQTGKESVKIFYDGNIIEMYLQYNGENQVMTVLLTDQNGAEIPLWDENGDGIYTLEDERFADIYLCTETDLRGNPFVAVNILDNWWGFTNQVGDHEYYYCAPGNIYTKMTKADAAVFTNTGTMGSGRGYIWSRTIPLLKDTLFVGNGPDTFGQCFPNDDYVGAWKNGFSGKNVGSPHNMYLWMGVNTGVISLIAFLVFCLFYLIDCVRLYWKESFKTFLPQAGLALGLAVFGYMLTGFLNDSMVCVAPVFWCLIGIGMAVNRMYRKEKEH